MSVRAERPAPRRTGLLSRAHTTRAQGSGFTLIEVIVSLTVLALAAAAVLPLLITAARAASTTKYESQARALGQERIERMRNLQFHVDVAAGPFVDMLDTYFPNNTTTPTGTTLGNVTDGYVSAASPRLAQEFPTGAFYRYIVPTGQLGTEFQPFRQIVNTQFLDASGAPYAFPSTTTYSNQTAGQDQPPTGMVRVRVITTWRVFNTQRSAVLLTDISNIRNAEPTLNAVGRATAVRVGGTLEAGSAENSGVVGEVATADVNGSVDLGASAQAVGVGAAGAQTPGSEALNSARLVLTAPPNVSSPTVSTTGGGIGSTCEILCFGASKIQNATAGVTSGQPTVGVTTPSVVPLRSELNATGSGNQLSFRFNPLFGGVPRAGLQLSATDPMVATREVVNGNPGTASSTGLLESGYTDPANHFIRTTSTSRVQVVEVMPTLFTPTYTTPSGTPRKRGIIQLELESSSLSCEANATGSVVDSSWIARVRYYSPGSGADADGYKVVDLTKGVNTTDPLPGLLNAPVGTGGLKVSDYIANWSSPLAPSQTSSTTFTGGKRVAAQLGGIVSLTSQPLRIELASDGSPLLDANGNTIPDTNSALTVQVGALSCQAEDSRS